MSADYLGERPTFNHDRFDKMMALALHHGTSDEEAMAAVRMARMQLDRVKTTYTDVMNTYRTMFKARDTLADRGLAELTRQLVEAHQKITALEAEVAHMKTEESRKDGTQRLKDRIAELIKERADLKKIIAETRPNSWKTRLTNEANKWMKEASRWERVAAERYGEIERLKSQPTPSADTTRISELEAEVAMLNAKLRSDPLQRAVKARQQKAKEDTAILRRVIDGLDPDIRKSAKRIAHWLNENGYKAPRGGLWDGPQIRSQLNRNAA